MNNQNNNLDKILDKLNKIEISIAVLYEKLNQVSRRLDNASDEFTALEARIIVKTDEMKQRIDRHDKIVGAVVISASILVALVKFGKL